MRRDLSDADKEIETLADAAVKDEGFSALSQHRYENLRFSNGMSSYRDSMRAFGSSDREFAEKAIREFLSDEDDVFYSMCQRDSDHLEAGNEAVAERLIHAIDCRLACFAVVDRLLGFYKAGDAGVALDGMGEIESMKDVSFSLQNGLTGAKMSFRLTLADRWLWLCDLGKLPKAEMKAEGWKEMAFRRDFETRCLIGDLGRFFRDVAANKL